MKNGNYLGSKHWAGFWRCKTHDFVAGFSFKLDSHIFQISRKKSIFKLNAAITPLKIESKRKK